MSAYTEINRLEKLLDDLRTRRAKKQEEYESEAFDFAVTSPNLARHQYRKSAAMKTAKIELDKLNQALNWHEVCLFNIKRLHNIK